MINIGIVDDNEQFVKGVQKCIQDYFEERELVCQISCFSDSVFFADEIIENQSYDICFLDIEMPQLDGIEVARKLRKSGSRVEIVFLTAYTSFFRSGYEVKAFDYLVKADISRELAPLLDRLLVYRDEKIRREYIIETSYMIERFPIEDIIYVCKKGKYAQFVLKNGENKQERRPLRDVIVKLSAEGFTLVEKGFIVNIDHIVKLYDGTVTMDNGTEIRVGRRYRGELKDRIRDCWLRRG